MDNSSENNLHHDSSPSRHSRSHSSRHSRHRYHRHSSQREKSKDKFYKNGKRRRLEEEPKRERLQKIENFFIKNVISIFGIIFLVGAIWFGIGTWKSLDHTPSITYEKTKNIDQTVSDRFNTLKSIFLSPVELKPAKGIINASFILILVLALIFILATLGISIRQKNILLKIISFMAWMVLSSWLTIRFFVTYDTIVFIISVVLLFIFSGLFFISGFVDSYIGRSKWKYKTEYWFLLVNSMFYFFIMTILLLKSGYKSYISTFIFLLSSLHLVAVYITDKKNLAYNKIPYLIATLIITCSFLPVIIKVSPIIVFLAPLSVFLILFSKYSRNHTSVLFSMGAMTIMVVVYLYQWLFDFIPDIVTMDGVMDKSIFYKGLVSSLFILPAFAFNNRLLKRLAIALSQKFLNKGKYLKFIKGLLLLIIYLSFYWIFNYILITIVKNEKLNSLIWFSFNCLYFIVYIPHLARQRSSFLRLIIIISIITSLTYFTLIHINIVQLRNLYIKAEGLTIYPFLFHYFTLALLIVMLLTLLRYFKRAFAGMKTLIKGFWVFIYLLFVFILLSEFDHLAVLYGFHNGIKMDDIIVTTRKLPYSLILLFSFFMILLSGFLIKSRFLRIFSLVILVAVLVKILAFDMISLQTQAKMILFLIMGLFLLGISMFYPRIKQTFFQKDSPRSPDTFSGNVKHRRSGH